MSDTKIKGEDVFLSKVTDVHTNLRYRHYCVITSTNASRIILQYEIHRLSDNTAYTDGR